MKKTISMVFITSLLTGCASTDKTQSQTPPPEMAGSAENNPDMTEFAQEVDSNHDGKLSRVEWQAKSLPESSFNAFEKGRGFVTLEDYQINAAPPGIDMNKAGKLTVLEFIAFNKQMSKNMPPPPPNK